MFNYLVNWDKVIKENVPSFLHKVKRLARISVMVKPLKDIHAELITLKDDYVFKVAYTSQVIYLEKILNDKFDNVDRGIYIEDKALFNNNYLYLAIESKPPRYVYAKWDATVNYNTGDHAVEGNKVYLALAPNINMQPTASPLDWVYHCDVTFYRMDIEYGAAGFVVMVPSTLVFDTNRMKALINYYRFASKHYTIQTY